MGEVGRRDVDNSKHRRLRLNVSARKLQSLASHVFALMSLYLDFTSLIVLRVGRRLLEPTGGYSAHLRLKMKSFSIRAFIPPLTRSTARTFGRPRVPALRSPLCAKRTYAIQNPGAPALEIFSHSQKWMQKERAASDVEGSRRVDYLRDEVASRLCERLMVSSLSAPPPLHSARTSTREWKEDYRSGADTGIGYKPPFPQGARSGGECV